MTLTFRTKTRAMAATALLVATPLLGGCQSGSSPAATGSIYPVDYRDRHPVVLTDAPRVLDVFVNGAAGIDGRERQDIASFVAEYRRYGRGSLIVQAPEGVSSRAIEAVRAATGDHVRVSRYSPLDPTIASPIRLTFKRLQAKVTSQCGLWPQDLGVADYEFNAANQQYWNQGCAYQSNFAAQVADPLDLVRPRMATAPDTLKRMQGIERLRAGSDASTVYKQDGQNKISTSLGN